jgi:hypothetical protein
MCVSNDAISGERNVVKKAAEKILKYKDLTIEIQSIWNVQTNMIPVMIGATGIISESFRKYQESIKSKNYNNNKRHIGHCSHTWESTTVKVQHI